MAVLVTLAPAQVQALPCDMAHTAVQGQPAPCDGQTLPDVQARALLGCARVDLPRCRADMDLHVALARVQQDGAKATATALQDALGRCEGLLAQQLGGPQVTITTPTITPWWQSPVTWGLAGGLLGLAAGLGVSVALR